MVQIGSRLGETVAKTKTGSRYRLGEALSIDMAAFCEANDDCPEIGVIRSAVSHYLAFRLNADAELRNRFEEARRRRSRLNGNPMGLVPK